MKVEKLGPSLVLPSTYHVQKAILSIYLSVECNSSILLQSQENATFTSLASSLFSLRVQRRLLFEIGTNAKELLGKTHTLFGRKGTNSKLAFKKLMLH